MGIPGSASQHATSYDIDLMPFDKMLDYVAMIKYRKKNRGFYDKEHRDPRKQYDFNCFVLDNSSKNMHTFFINLKKCLDQKKGQGNHFCLLIYGTSHWFVLDFIITSDFKLKILYLDSLDYYKSNYNTSMEITAFINTVQPKSIITLLFDNNIGGQYIQEIFFWFPGMQITSTGCGIFALDMAIQLTKMHENRDYSFYDAFEKNKGDRSYLFDNAFKEIRYYVLDNCTSIFIPPSLLRMNQNYNELNEILAGQKRSYPQYHEIAVSRKPERSTLGTYRGERVMLGSSYKNIALTQKFRRLKQKLYDFEIKTFPATRADKIIAGYKKEIETGEDFFRDLGVG